MLDAGNTVVFSKSGSYIENTTTGEKISLKCEKGTYTMAVNVPHLEVTAVEVATDPSTSLVFRGQAA